MDNYAAIVIALRQQNELLKGRLDAAQRENAALARQFDAIYEQIRAVQNNEPVSLEMHCNCGRSWAFGSAWPLICATVRETMRFDASALGKSFTSLYEAVGRIERAFAHLQIYLHSGVAYAPRKLAAALECGNQTSGVMNQQEAPDDAQGGALEAQTRYVAGKGQAFAEAAVQTEAEHSLKTEVNECKRRLETASAACQRLAVENEALKEEVKYLQHGQQKAEYQTGKWPQLITLQRQCEILEKVLEMAFTR